MSEPDETTNTATASGEPEGAVDTSTSTDESQKSYFDSPETISTRINELTHIAETGSETEIADALREMDEIETRLSNPPEEDTKPPKPPADSQDETASETSTSDEATKKFRVYYNGEAVEVDDKNNLLGRKNTGDLKAAFVKEQLRAKEIEKENADLATRLREVEAKLKAPTPAPAKAEPPREVRTPAPQVAVSMKPKPVAPEPPNLSTNDPTLYTEADIAAIGTYQADTAKFNKEISDYVDYVASRPPQIDPILKSEIEALKQNQQANSSVISQVEQERRNLAEEKADVAHWRTFSDFQDKHEVFKTSVPPKQLNSDMNAWMDKLAAANGVPRPVNGSNDPGWNGYLTQRAGVIERYQDGDSTVLKNAEGIDPPEDHDKFFKLAELNHMLDVYKNKGILGENATLEDAYLRTKSDSGELANAIESVRVDERVSATTEFANNIENIQKEATGVDPASSANGPDLTAYGVPKADMEWFARVSKNPDNIHTMKSKDPDTYKKWLSIANRIEAVALK